MRLDGGEVAQVGFEEGGFGNYILIRHPWGESIYAHLASTAVTQGQVVARGQYIGVSDNSGGSTGLIYTLPSASIRISAPMDGAALAIRCRICRPTRLSCRPMCSIRPAWPLPPPCRRPAGVQGRQAPSSMGTFAGD